MKGTIEKTQTTDSTKRGGVMDETKEGIKTCNIDLLKVKYTELEQLAKGSTDKEVDFYYHLLEASFHPEDYTASYIVSKNETYWQVFWAVLAFLKIGNIDSAMVLVPHVADFDYPHGNMLLLRAVVNLVRWSKRDIDYFRRDAMHYLRLAKGEGITPQLSPLMVATEERLKDSPKPVDPFRFYYNIVLSPTITFTVNKNPDK